MDAGNVSAIISAISGLAGVGMGGYLTHRREQYNAKLKDERDIAYLAVLVGSHLDRFANGCWACALDDGTAYGQPAGGDGRYEVTAESPQFKPHEIDVEWKVLPKALLYDILQIPDKREHINNRLIVISEHSDAYDAGEYFWSRQRDYAELGLHTSDVVKRLRMHAGLPVEDTPPAEWNRERSLQEVIDDIDQKRAAHEKRLAESNKNNSLFSNLGKTLTSGGS